MYKQPNHSYTSTDSLRRLSSNNPFRQQEQAQRYEGPKLSNRSNLSVNSSDNRLSNFDDWVEKNKQLVELSSDEDEPFRPVNMHQKSRLSPNNSGEYSKPVLPPPGPIRAGSDSSVNYNNVYVYTLTSQQESVENWNEIDGHFVAVDETIPN